MADREASQLLGPVQGKPPQKRAELLLTLLVFLLVNLVSSQVQDQIQVNHGLGNDGAVYYQMAEDYHRHVTPSQEPPFVFRIGLPLLACWIDGDDLKKGFLFANLSANLLIVVLLFYWLGIWVRDWKLRLLLNLLFQTNWVLPVRIVWFYPTLSDHWALVFILAGLLVLSADMEEGWKSALLGLLGFTGVFFREILFVLPVAFLLTGWKQPPYSAKRLFLKVAPLLLAAAGWWLVHQSFLVTVIRKPGHGLYHFYNTAVRCFFSYCDLSAWILSWFSAFGPILGVLIIRPKVSFNFLKRHPAVTVVFAQLVFLSWIGGRDFERFFTWPSPIVLALLGLTLEASPPLFKQKWPAALLLALQLVSQRFFWTIPSFDRLRPCPLSDCKIWLTVFGEHVDCLDLQGYYEDPGVRTVRLAQYFLILVAMGVFHYFSRRGKSASGTDISGESPG